MNVHPACLVRENAAEIWGRNGLGQNGKAQITADTMRRSVARCSVVGMYCYLFDEPEMIKVEEIVLPPKENTEEDEGETVKKKIYIFPPEWAGTFGQPITSIAQVGILRQEHYAGNWDVFRPATEIEEMNIFTAESLNELLREAEKIMEGWTDYR